MHAWIDLKQCRLGCKNQDWASRCGADLAGVCSFTILTKGDSDEYQQHSPTVMAPGVVTLCDT